MLNYQYTLSQSLSDQSLLFVRILGLRPAPRGKEYSDLQRGSVCPPIHNPADVSWFAVRLERSLGRLIPGFREKGRPLKVQGEAYFLTRNNSVVQCQSHVRWCCYCIRRLCWGFLMSYTHWRRDVHPSYKSCNRCLCSLYLNVVLSMKHLNQLSIAR
jgi:hypothetical protein